MKKKDVCFNSMGDKIVGVLFLPDLDNPCPALIICHGALEFKENYFELCEFLTGKGIASLAMDMHGHGESEGERFHVNMKEWVADIQAAIDFLEEQPEIDKDKIGAFGLSSGGTAVLEAALVEPRLKVLITLDATVRNSLSLSETLLLKTLILIGEIKKLFTGKDLRLSFVSMLKNTHFASDPEIDKKLHEDPRLIEAFSSFPLPGASQCFFVDTVKRVNKITIPTLVIWGEDDQLDSPESARMLYDNLTCKKELHIIPGNGHMGHLDRNKDKVFELTSRWALENLKVSN